MPDALGRPVIVHEGHRLLDQSLGQFNRVGNRGRSQNELGRRTIKVGDSFQATQNVGHVRAEHPAIDVHLVDYHKLQMPEKIGPQGVMR